MTDPVVFEQRDLTAMRQQARELFLHALAESSVERAFERQVEYSRGVLRVSEDLYNLSAFSRVLVIALGKAAHNMAESLAARIGRLASGIVATPVAVEGQVPAFRYFRGGHPLPNSESLRAGEAILKAVHGLNEVSMVIYLISGGGSAVAEKPLDSDISLEDLVETYRLLVHCGASIAEINAVRKHLSQLKGGRLARAADNAQQLSIMISDVPDDALDSLASGPTMPDNSTVEDCYRIVDQYALRESLPASVRDLIAQRALEETPTADDPAFRRSRWWPILSNATPVKAAAAKAAELGFAVEVDNSCDDWDYRRAADHLLDRLRRLRSGASRVCLISGGEVRVRVPEGAGRGGRNLQFTLYCAGKIAGENITVLSAGTDGVDGNSPAAGAVADGSTLQRYSALGSGRSLHQVLQQFDAHTAFESLGDAIVTGPTGTNVRDLRVLVAY